MAFYTLRCNNFSEESWNKYITKNYKILYYDKDNFSIPTYFVKFKNLFCW